MFYVGYVKNMKLTDAEISYFSHNAQTRNQDIAVKFYAESNRLVPLEDGVSQTQIYVARIKTFAKDVIESRVDTYIEVCKKYNKFPDGEDVHSFVTESKPYVLRKIELFQDYLKNPFGENIHKSVADAIERSLDAGLQKIFTDGLRPLHSFYLEGKVEEEGLGQDVENPIIKEADDKVVGSPIYNIAGDFVGGDQTKAGDNLGGTQISQVAV